MLTFLKYSTVICSITLMVIMALLAANTSPGVTPWYYFGVIAFYVILLLVLFGSEAKQFKPGYWIAFILAFAPILLIFITFFLYASGNGC